MINRTTSFEELAFLVCTALDQDGTTAVLSGGGAATIYAPLAHQSRDLDFIIQFTFGIGNASASPILDLGFVREGGTYVHPDSDFTVEFPIEPLAIGEELVRTWHTMRNRDLLLHIISPTDCVRDRLAWYLFNNDHSSLQQALGVALAQPIDLQAVESWCTREGEPGKFRIFKERLERLAHQ